MSEAARAYRGPATGHYYRAKPEVKAQIAGERSAMRQMARLYDAEIAHVDYQLGRLLAMARKKSGAGGLWVVLTADHGESFGEHNNYFGRDAYQPTLHVPLIIVAPGGGSGKVIESTVGLVDIAPTVLEILDTGADEKLDGESLIPMLGGQGGPDRSVRSLIAPVPDWRPAELVTRRGRYKAVWRAPGWRVESFTAASRELYDLDNDPDELNDLAAAQMSVYDQLLPPAERGAIDLLLAPTELDATQIRKLRRLGYVR